MAAQQRNTAPAQIKSAPEASTPGRVKYHVAAKGASMAPTPKKICERFIHLVEEPGFSSVSRALPMDSLGPKPTPVRNNPTKSGTVPPAVATHTNPRHIKSAAQSTTRRLPMESESMPETNTLHKEPMA